MLQQFKQIDFNNAAEKKAFDALVASDPLSFIQQTTWWASVVQDVAGDFPVYLYREDPPSAMSFYLFRGPFGSILSSNIQPGTLGAFSCSREDAAQQGRMYKEMLDAVVEVARRENCMSISIASNPLVPEEKTYIEDFLAPETQMQTFIQAVPIREYMDVEGRVLLRDYHRRSCLSRNLKKAGQAEFSFSRSSSHDELMDWYHRTHCPRIRSLGGNPLPRMIFDNIAPEMAAGNAAFFTVKEKSDIVAGAVCIFKRGSVLDNYMMSSRPDATENGASYFLVDRLLRWCWREKFTLYNWQSSNPPDGGIFRFKQRWGSRIYPYAFYTKILDKAKFAKLRTIPLPEIMTAYQGHFLAPTPTIVHGEYGEFSKAQTNRLLRPAEADQ